jgi:hypothetical protein
MKKINHWIFFFRVGEIPGRKEDSEVSDLPKYVAVMP